MKNITYEIDMIYNVLRLVFKKRLTFNSISQLNFKFDVFYSMQMKIKI